MKFFAFSALISVAAAGSYGSTGFVSSGLSGGLSTGYGSGYRSLSAQAPSGFRSVSLPSFQKMGAASFPSLSVRPMGLATNGYSGGYSGSFAGGLTYGQAAVAPLAVQTSHQIEYRDIPSGGQINPIAVDIQANPIPINLNFQSASSQLNVQQAHQGAIGSVQESSSEDEAHILRHSVTKPVLQEIREVITPFRRISQEIQPVSEQVNTVVARGVQRALPAYEKTLVAPVQASGSRFVAKPASVKLHTTALLGQQSSNTYSKEY